MATLVNRKMFWALNHKVIPCLVVKRDLSAATVDVLLENGARHTVNAYDVRATEQEATDRMREIRRRYDATVEMAYRHQNVF